MIRINIGIKRIWYKMDMNTEFQVNNKIMTEISINKI